MSVRMCKKCDIMRTIFRIIFKLQLLFFLHSTFVPCEQCALNLCIYVFGFAFYLFIYFCLGLISNWKEMESDGKIKNNNEKKNAKRKEQIKYGVYEMSEKPNMVSFVHAQCYCKWVSRVDTGTMCTEYAIHILHFLHHLVRAVNIFDRNETNKKPRTKACASLLSDERQRSTICSAGVPMYLTPQNVCKWIDWRRFGDAKTAKRIRTQKLPGWLVDPNENYWISAMIALHNFSTALTARVPNELTIGNIGY